jgi:prolyl-tRNA synthetase
MLASKLYSPTLREIPADAEIASHQYMLKAGMLRKNGSGLYSFLPLGRRVTLKVEQIVRYRRPGNHDAHHAACRNLA